LKSKATIEKTFLFIFILYWKALLHSGSRKYFWKMSSYSMMSNEFARVLVNFVRKGPWIYSAGRVRFKYENNWYSVLFLTIDINYVLWIKAFCSYRSKPWEANDGSEEFSKIEIQYFSCRSVPVLNPVGTIEYRAVGNYILSDKRF
jgi:hypothetical protein